MTNQQLFTALLSGPSPNALTEYARADMVVLRCDEPNYEYGLLWHNKPFWTTIDQFENYESYDICIVCHKRYTRLLATGQWQSAEERQAENERRLRKVR